MRTFSLLVFFILVLASGLILPSITDKSTTEASLDTRG